MRALGRLLVLATPIIFIAAPSIAKKPPAARLADSNLFRRLYDAKRTDIWRLEGEVCDSVGEGVSTLECFSRVTEMKMRSRPWVLRSLNLLAKCTWVRLSGPTAPASPTLGFRFRGDSLDAFLLLSLQARRVTLTLPGQGGIVASIPEWEYPSLCRCIWRIDPGFPEVAESMVKELNALGIDPTITPAQDEDGLLPVGVSTDGKFMAYDVPPEVVSRVEPAYPEMAREAQIQGKVVLHALVERDGRVSSVKVAKSVNYLDAAAKDAVSKWLFKPALLNGEPVTAWTVVSLDFHL